MTQTIIILYLLSCVIIISGIQSFSLFRQKSVGNSRVSKLLNGFLKSFKPLRRPLFSHSFTINKKVRNGILYSSDIAKLFFVKGSKYHNRVYALSTEKKEIFEEVSVVQMDSRTLVLNGEVKESCLYNRAVDNIKLRFKEEVVGTNIVKTLFIKNNSNRRQKLVYINKIICNTNDFIEQKHKGCKYAFSFDDTFLEISCSSVITTSIKTETKPAILLTTPIVLTAKASKSITLTYNVCKSIDAKYNTFNVSQPHEQSVSNYTVLDEIIYRHFNYRLPQVGPADYSMVDMLQKEGISFNGTLLMVNKHEIAQSCKSLLEQILDMKIIERGSPSSLRLPPQIEKFSLLHPSAHKVTVSTISFKKVALDGTFGVIHTCASIEDCIQKLAVFLYKRQSIFTKVERQEQGFLLTNYLDKTPFYVESRGDMYVWKLNKECRRNRDIDALSVSNAEIKKQVFAVAISCADKKIESLINDVLPDKILHEYSKNFEFTSLFSFLDRQEKAISYHHKYVIERLLRNERYAMLYTFLLRRVVGIQALGSYVRFYTGSMLGNVEIDVSGHKMIKSNDKGTRVLYEGIIYNNVYVLKLKNKNEKSDRKRESQKLSVVEKI